MKRGRLILLVARATPLTLLFGCASAGHSVSKPEAEHARTSAVTSGSLVVGSRVRITTTPPETEQGDGWFSVKGRIVEESEAWLTLAVGPGDPFTLAKSGMRLTGGLFGSGAGRLTVIPDDHPEPVTIPVAAVTSLEVAISKDEWGPASASAPLVVLPGTRLRVSTRHPHGQRVGPDEILYAGRVLAQDQDLVTLVRGGEQVTRTRPGRSVSGVFLRSDGEGLSLRPDGAEVAARFLISDIATVECSVTSRPTLVPGVGLMTYSGLTYVGLTMAGPTGILGYPLAVAGVNPVVAPFAIGALLASSGREERWVSVTPDLFRRPVPAAHLEADEP